MTTTQKKTIFLVYMFCLIAKLGYDLISGSLGDSNILMCGVILGIIALPYVKRPSKIKK